MAYAVLTRDLAGAAAYAEVLAPLGLAVIAMPVTHTVPPADAHALSRALSAGGYGAIFLASARAATALERARGPMPLPEVWAVGPATARVLATAGIPATQPAGAIDGATLARAMLAEPSLAGKRVLVPRAEDGRDEAIAILRAAGIVVDEVVAYRTVPTPPGSPVLALGTSLFASAGVAVCALFAPSQVQALAALLAPVGLADAATVFAAIGETTAAALRAAGVARVAVAATPTPSGLANAVAAVYPPRT